MIKPVDALTNFIPSIGMVGSSSAEFIYFFSFSSLNTPYCTFRAKQGRFIYVIERYQLSKGATRRAVSRSRVIADRRNRRRFWSGEVITKDDNGGDDGDRADATGIDSQKTRTRFESLRRVCPAPFLFVPNVLIARSHSLLVSVPVSNCTLSEKKLSKPFDKKRMTTVKGKKDRKQGVEIESSTKKGGKGAIEGGAQEPNRKKRYKRLLTHTHVDERFAITTDHDFFDRIGFVDR